MNKIYLEEDEIRQITKHLLNAILYCHKELKIVIGNLHPEAIILDKKIGQNHVRIMNF